MREYPTGSLKALEERAERLKYEGTIGEEEASRDGNSLVQEGARLLWW